ncbi:MAG: TRAM domain-containing protein, partial [Proteobacteria bacterium]|nr:TRAM domain-containing protein [Pseudomonadota bacterium]
MLDLQIERLASDGSGIGHAPDGRIVFAPFTAPGDHIRAKVASAKRNFLRVDVQELLKPGADRVKPPCPLFSHCGGCSWQHIDYAAQVLAKQMILTDALTRIGGQTLKAAVVMTPSPRPFGYR